MLKIFISYHRDVSIDAARSLYDRLSMIYDPDNVCYDRVSIPRHQPYEQYIKDWINNECDIFLILLASDIFSNVHDDNDLIRKELSWALENERIRVIPIQLEDFEKPEDQDLPDEIKNLLTYHPIPWDHNFFEAVIDTIKVTIEHDTSIELTLSPSKKKNLLLQFVFFVSVSTFLLIYFLFLLLSRVIDPQIAVAFVSGSGVIISLAITLVVTVASVNFVKDNKYDIELYRNISFVILIILIIIVGSMRFFLLNNKAEESYKATETALASAAEQTASAIAATTSAIEATETVSMMGATETAVIETTETASAMAASETAVIEARETASAIEATETASAIAATETASAIATSEAVETEITETPTPTNTPENTIRLSSGRYIDRNPVNRLKMQLFYNAGENGWGNREFWSPTVTANENAPIYSIYASPLPPSEVPPLDDGSPYGERLQWHIAEAYCVHVDGKLPEYDELVELGRYGFQFDLPEWTLTRVSNGNYRIYGPDFPEALGVGWNDMTPLPDFAQSRRTQKSLTFRCVYG